MNNPNGQNNNIYSNGNVYHIVVNNNNQAQFANIPQTNIETKNPVYPQHAMNNSQVMNSQQGLDLQNIGTGNI